MLDIDRARSEGRLLEWAGGSVKLTKDGNEHKGLCPFHNEKTPSFHIFNGKDGVERYHCLAAETGVIVKEGVRPIGSLAGSTVEILSRGGEWVSADFRSYGVQRLHKIELSRNHAKKTIFATSGHRWFTHERKGSVLTTDLRPGHRLESAMPLPRSSWSVDPEGVRHGIVFGDGTLIRGRLGLVCLYGGKGEDLTRWFPDQDPQKKKLENGDPYIRIYGGKDFGHMKLLPSLDESEEYLLGFLAGYLATDGHVAKDGTVSLSSAEIANLEWARAAATRLGISTYGITTQTRRGYGSEDSDISRVHFVTSSLNSNIILRNVARERFRNSKKAFERTRWAVVSVEKSDREEEVYCAEVPVEHAFALEDNILTGNCFGCAAGGDVLDFIMETRGVSIQDAVAMILGDTEDTGNRREKKDAPPAHDPYEDVKPLDHMPSLMPVPGEKISVWNPKREKHSTYTPEAVYKYQCGIVLRVVIEGKKLTPMLMWCEVDGVAQWSHYAFPRPRLAYGRELVTDEGQIVIVEGEKTADAARTYLNMSIVTYAGGTNGVQFTDWSFTKGRDVIVIPDADQPGRDAAEQLCAILADNGAQSIRVVDATEMEAVKKGWDIADALSDGWDKSKVVDFVKKNLADWSRAQSKEIEAAADDATLPVEAQNDWRVEILHNADGEPRAKSSYNYMQFLRHHEDFLDIFHFNEFSLGITMVRCPPWEDPDSFNPKDVDDEDITFCQGWLERFGLSPTYDATRKAILATASKNKFHPARDYFETLRGKWDGVNRLDDWLVDYVGAKPTRFAQLAGRKWMVAAVRRTYEPGVKFDSMLVLEGPQGEGKSTILAELARFGGESYFTDDFPEINRDTIMNCMGTLIVEIAEMDGFSRADITKIKSFITRQEDRIRLPYAATILKAKRQFVMAGTINPNNGYLRDPTGGRRFWPVWCDGVDVPGLKLAREQLWAEAVQLHLDGEAIYLKDGEVALAQAEQADRYKEDVWADIIDSYIRGLREVTVIEILTHLEIPAERMDLLKEKRVSAHLEHRRWLREKRLANGDATSGWLYRSPARHSTEVTHTYEDDFPDLDQMGEEDGA